MAGIITAIGDACMSFVMGVAFAGVVASTVLYVTKPPKETLWTYLDKELSSKGNKAGSIGQRLASWGLTTIAEKTSTTIFEEYGIYRVADVTLLNGEKLRVYGIFNGWYPDEHLYHKKL